jgi:UDP:flavonoid glycosyltransferase YjiC (YdhE family)
LHGHLAVKSAKYNRGMSYEPSTIAIMRRALDEVLADARFHRCTSASALEIAEHILAATASGERDLERLKASSFAKLAETSERLPKRAA